ncbi:uncharacterized protein PFL1_04081 [Pseudozyma flocculosa PF-1]|uniref:Uncharacterized protein n=2 Tax=Pseudozyma flocculosa TaxID=84751 RepID=A0A5C3ESS0_9BASI|nr:uncharacterized protein PFL1_04081 [Pseudozyma flocculosa PF-1]EPQ28254.1 hypothetical protein PFL1_04081 [Pseudozyma flocculosa PF-1]SPO35394.1 uncharacterized protein PSFLO_00865 [Pseudozyma flocculosa]
MSAPHPDGVTRPLARAEDGTPSDDGCPHFNLDKATSQLKALTEAAQFSAVDTFMLYGLLEVHGSRAAILGSRHDGPYSDPKLVGCLEKVIAFYRDCTFDTDDGLDMLEERFWLPFMPFCKPSLSMTAWAMNGKPKTIEDFLGCPAAALIRLESELMVRAELSLGLWEHHIRRNIEQQRRQGRSTVPICLPSEHRHPFWYLLQADGQVMMPKHPEGYSRAEIAAFIDSHVQKANA